MKMFKVTIKCENMKAEELAKVLERRISGFKIWLYENTTYASFRLKSLNELSELDERLAEVKGVQFDCIKIEKVSRFWTN